MTTPTSDLLAVIIASCNRMEAMISEHDTATADRLQAIEDTLDRIAGAVGATPAPSPAPDPTIIAGITGAPAQSTPVKSKLQLKWLGLGIGLMIGFIADIIMGATIPHNFLAGITNWLIVPLAILIIVVFGMIGYVIGWAQDDKRSS